MTFVSVTMNDSDRRLLIALLIVLLILFVILGLIGMLIRFINRKFAERMDDEIHDALYYRIIQDPKTLKRYGRAKNNRRFFKQMLPPFAIAVASVIIYVIYSAFFGNWADNHFARFGTLLIQFDWSDPSLYSQFFGLTLLSKWPTVLSYPRWVGEYFVSYVLVTMWIVAGIYWLIVVQAYAARTGMLRRRLRTVFNKSLENFNFYDAAPNPAPYAQAANRQAANDQNPPRRQ
jgi:ABC-type multidrug transport system fused ATPase/permease subunit